SRTDGLMAGPGQCASNHERLMCEVEWGRCDWRRRVVSGRRDWHDCRGEGEERIRGEIDVQGAARRYVPFFDDRRAECGGTFPLVPFRRGCGLWFGRMASAAAGTAFLRRFGLADFGRNRLARIPTAQAHAGWREQWQGQQKGEQAAGHGVLDNRSSITYD